MSSLHLIAHLFVYVIYKVEGMYVCTYMHVVFVRTCDGVYVCMYVCMYVMYVCMYECLYVCMFVCLFVGVQV